MAKAKKSTSAVEKISAEELEQLQGLQKSIGSALNSLSNIEIAKFELLNDHSRMKVAMQELSAQLQEKYGEVNISLVDGVISEVPAQEAEMEVAK
jgi:hypothetical protein